MSEIGIVPGTVGAFGRIESGAGETRPGRTNAPGAGPFDRTLPISASTVIGVATRGSQGVTDPGSGMA